MIEIKGIYSYSYKMLILLILVNMFCVESIGRKPFPGMIYILLWTTRHRQPFEFWKLMRKSFIAMNCEHQNCYITENRNLFEDLTDFDAILFNAINIIGEIDFPPIRSDNQLYIFVSTESSVNYRVGLDEYNYFFNYTWTYRLNSDLTYPYLVVRDWHGKVIGPKKHVHWMKAKKMKPTSESVKERLKNKTIAAAWFVTNCLASNPRLHYTHNLNEALNDYNLYIDIYGGCGNKDCPRNEIDRCLSLVETDYYFYLSFENSYSEDYVTEKLMTALDHYAVPIVLGGANYSRYMFIEFQLSRHGLQISNICLFSSGCPSAVISIMRFMPDGIYINAKNFTERELASKMNELIHDKEKYYDMFKWRNYYSYHSVAESGETDPLCAFCAFLNDDSKRNQRRVYARFTEWWNDLVMANDTIVQFENSDPKIKSYYSFKPAKIEPAATASVMNHVNNFVDTIYNYYSELK